MAGPLDLDYPRALLAALALVTVLAIVVAAGTSAASFGVYNARWDGASDLRAAARASGAGVEIARNTTAYGNSPGGTVAVVLSPDDRYGPGDAARIRAFLDAGGTLVVAEDFGPNANPLLAAVGASARFDGRLLRDERYYFRSPAMPVARNVSPSPLTRGVEAVTLNYGTPVEPGNATPLVRTSAYAYVDGNRNGALDDAERLGPRPVVTVEAVGNGSVIALGDPSALINVMLERPGNSAFVRNLFGSGEHVLLDYSHVGGLPPLAVALLVLRESVALQLLSAGGAVAAVWLWGRGAGVGIRRRVRDRREPEPPPGTLGEAELETFLRDRHPGWEPERVRRVIGGILTIRGERGDDD